MKNRLFLILLLIGLYHLAPVCLHANKFTIHIKLKDTTALRSVAAVDTSLALDRIFQYSPKFEERHRKAGLNLWYMVTVNDSARSANLMAAYKALPGVDKVDEDEKGFFSRAYEVTPVPASELRASEELPVNDPLYTQQWDLKNRVFPKAVDINIEKAWQIETGSSDVIVAIMDEPFDVSHEDLRANVWVNEKELNGKPEIDDDGNGYVDDIYGYGPSLRLGDHGTHVAGTIAAVNNNGKGVCGIAGGNGSKPGVKIMRCQMFSGRSAIQKAEAYIYAADNGAVISQNSWVNIDGDYNAVVLDGIKYFMEFAGQNEGAPMKGGLVVWGAGNDNHSRKISPNINPNLNKENLITVAAVVPDGDKASFSNYGDCIDIAAPGGEYNRQATLSTILGNRYGYMQGTSMACPHISGIAALVVSHFKGATLTPKDVKKRILSSVTDVNQFMEGQEGYGKMGAGIADAWKALLDDQHKKPEVVKDLWFSRNVSSLIELSWTIPCDIDDKSIDSCIVYYDTRPISDLNEAASRFSIYTGGFSTGDTMRYRILSPQAGATYYLRMQSKDRWGNSSDLSQEISCKPVLDTPLIYGQYLFNRFYTYQNNPSYGMQPDSLYLNYTILTPKNKEVEYKLEDSGKAVQIISDKDNQLNLSIAPADQEAKEYQARIIAWVKGDNLNADTLSFSYVVRPRLEYPLPKPELREGKSLEFKLNQLKGSLSFDLQDYFVDPRGYGLFFTYNENQNEEKDPGLFHGLQASLRGDSLFVDYEYDDDLLAYDNNKISFELEVVTLSGIKGLFVFKLFYDVSTEIEKIEKTSVRVFPNPVEGLIQIQSADNVKEVYIYSLEGYMVYQMNEPGGQLDLSNLPKGVYLMQIVTSKDNVVKKIIKK